MCWHYCLLCCFIIQLHRVCVCDSEGYGSCTTCSFKARLSLKALWIGEEKLIPCFYFSFLIRWFFMPHFILFCWLIQTHFSNGKIKHAIFLLQLGFLFCCTAHKGEEKVNSSQEVCEFWNGLRKYWQLRAEAADQSVNALIMMFFSSSSPFWTCLKAPLETQRQHLKMNWTWNERWGFTGGLYADIQ